jgi:hypothetical protein
MTATNLSVVGSGPMCAPVSRVRWCYTINKGIYILPLSKYMHEGTYIMQILDQPQLNYLDIHILANVL